MAERRALLEAQWQKVELQQREERMALHTAQKQEREKPFARASMFVFGLLDRVSVLKKVLKPLYENPSLNIKERQQQENELLDRRFGRERQVLDRRLAALGRVETCENKSMARDQRRMDAALDRSRGQAVDDFGKAASDRDKSKGQDAKPDQKQAPKKRRPRGFTMKP